MRLIKFILWILVTISLAYFMADIKIGGKTIKETIDNFVHSDKGDKAKRDIYEWIDEKVKSSLDTMPEPKTSTPEINKEEKGDITKADISKLKKIITETPFQDKPNKKEPIFLDDK